MLVVFINPGEITFSVIKIVDEAVHPVGVSPITTTLAPSATKIGGVSDEGRKMFVELV